jgi:hypothetical protein
MAEQAPDPWSLVGRTVTKISTRADRTFLTFVVRSSMDVGEIRLYFDGEFEVDPEVPGSDDETLELPIYLKLGEVPGCTVEHAEAGPDGDLHVEFSNGIRVTTFGAACEQPPFRTWQLEAR